MIPIQTKELESVSADIVSIPRLTRVERILYDFHNKFLGNKHITPAYVMKYHARLLKGYKYFSNSDEGLNNSELENLADAETDL